MIRHLVVVLLAAAALTPAACSSAGSGTESDDVGTSAKPETKSPVVQREIDVKMRRKSTGGTGTERLAYGLAVKLGTKLTSTPACDVAGPEGTVVVPVTITVTNPHRADGGKDTGVPGERWARPRHLTVEPVGVPGGELQFAPSSATQECGQDTRIADRSRDEDFDEGRTFVIAGFLSGVPRTGAAGAGVRVDFFDDEDWVAVSGDTQPFTVTF